jgi:hypothetical protein
MSQIERNIRRDVPLMAAWEAGTAAAVVLFMAIFAVSISQARTTNAAEPDFTQTRAGCLQQYNSLVHQAARDLSKGDGSATVQSLRAAQEQLYSCSVRGTQELRLILTEN